MRYTQSQVRGLISISVDDFKTWRKLISALAAHKGHGPTFAPGDVVALAIVAELVRDFGIRVGTIAAQLDRLFADCHGRSWVSLESCVLLLKADEVQLTDETAAQGRLSEQTTIAVPCARIIARLQSALTDSEAIAAGGHFLVNCRNIRAGRFLGQQAARFRAIGIVFMMTDVVQNTSPEEVTQ